MAPVTAQPRDRQLPMVEAAELVCHCRKVTYDAVREALRKGGASSLSEVQRQTTACTRCFGCRFELDRMLVEELGEAYRREPFITRQPVPEKTAPAGPLQRVLARVRRRPPAPRSEKLPRRMYMPVLSGYRGHGVETRVIVFNWEGQHEGDARAVGLRADVLAMDGTRLAAHETIIEPQCSAVLHSDELVPDGIPGGIGVAKLVVEQEFLGSFRPYFQLVSGGGTTSTHEKSGTNPYKARPRSAHWIVPVGPSLLHEEAYMFVTNTQALPMEDQLLTWQEAGGGETSIPFPRLELDQSACVPLHEHFPVILDGAAGSVRLSPPLHKVAGFTIRHDPGRQIWRVQHM